MMQKAVGLKYLWITNGFYTVHIPREEFQYFQGHTDDTTRK